MIRFTKTEKWSDAWFRSLSPIEKIVWIYLCDNCNNAGIIEIDLHLASFQVGCTADEFQGALKGLARGLQGASKPLLFRLRTFLKHQKNENLNPTNKAHVQVLRLIKENRTYFPSFYEEYQQQIEGASKGLPSPIGIGRGILDVKEERECEREKQETLLPSFPEYDMIRKCPPLDSIRPERYAQIAQSYPKIDHKAIVREACLKATEPDANISAPDRWLISLFKFAPEKPKAYKPFVANEPGWEQRIEALKAKRATEQSEWMKANG